MKLLTYIILILIFVLFLGILIYLVTNMIIFEDFMSETKRCRYCGGYHCWNGRAWYYVGTADDCICNIFI